VLLGRTARTIFDLLEAATRNLVAMSTLCAELYDRFPEAGDRVLRIREAEEQGDTITRELYEALHRTVSTPMPRGHLLALARALDGVADAVEEAATELELVGVQSVPERARAQARLVLHACERLADAVERLRDRPNLEGEVADIYALEDEGDQIVRDALARLFASGAEPLEIVRTKTLHDRLEQAVDSTKAAAAALERIAIATR
jgi:predicted phosphate transport protein (TIGR00153 family)